MTNTNPTWEDRDEEFEIDDPREDEQVEGISVNDFDGLVLAPSDWTVGTIYSQIGQQIDLDPEFQRRNVWSKKAKSKFIESIFLGVPIPQILLSSRKDSRSRYLVLDGKQRLTTIKEFLNGKYDGGTRFKLRNLSVLDAEIGGQDWPQISKDEDWKDRFNNGVIRAAVLKGWENEEVLYEIFHRLNSGSVRLSPMELRMSLHPGPFLKHIINWTETIGPLHHLLRKKSPDPRMADVELSIRHLAFSDPEMEYNGNLKLFLDNCSEKYNALYENDGFENVIVERLDAMNRAIALGIDIFGEKRFCRKWLGEAYETRFNRALFDVLVGSLSNKEFYEWANSNKLKVEESFKLLFTEDNDFVRSVETTTKSVENTSRRFEKWYGSVEQISGISIEIPSIQ
ncbi:DUF262 domain-containing protein [Parasphingorhabdus litoris]|uniref:DUF262 domain-containing protein n=1 Tax=Parasphingorhabdus litoris TaxID=394733 RepID=A0ABP3K2W7_9SPHN|nr:DUF262 domain-containing protein [Parasphingorhabdus litoris]